MTILLLGLLIFLGTHSLRIVADDWRTAQIARFGDKRWKGVFALLSLLGLGLIVYGFGISRLQDTVLWTPPLWTRHLAGLLTVPVFILLTATYLPGSRIKAKLGHPMFLAIKLWALAHLLANGGLADVVLFAAFLLWASLGFRAARRRDRIAGTSYPAGTGWGDVRVVVVGLLAWGTFAFYLHTWLIGVRPFG